MKMKLKKNFRRSRNNLKKISKIKNNNTEPSQGLGKKKI
uniref:Uncharacterized protein n=1 Tax=Amphimedon queenslandica TaxID=400682 RepID=I1EA93_AMPQE